MIPLWERLLVAAAKAQPIVYTPRLSYGATGDCASAPMRRAAPRVESLPVMKGQRGKVKPSTGRDYQPMTSRTFRSYAAVLVALLSGATAYAQSFVNGPFAIDSTGETGTPSINPSVQQADRKSVV